MSVVLSPWSFLLCSVCLSVHLTVESYAICWPARSRNQSKITAKIDRKSMPGEALGHPKSTQNRSRDPLGTHHGVQEHPEGVSGASWECLGASPACPGSARGVPESAPGRQKERPGALGSVLRRLKSTPSRCRERKNRVFLARAFAKHRRSNFSSIFVNFRFFCKVCEPLKVLRLPAKTEVRPFALRVESLAYCNLEKTRKSSRLSTRNR